MQHTRGPWIHDLASSSVLLVYCEGRECTAAHPLGSLPQTHVIHGDAAGLDAARHQTGAGSTILCNSRGVTALISGSKPVALAGTESTDAVLRMLLTRRKWYLSHRDLTPIVSHAILSDQRTVAIVDPQGSIVWCCLPRIDSTAMFAAMLADPSRGIFSVTPVAPPTAPAQRYIDDSFVLQTAWGPYSVTDYLDCSSGRPYQRPGRSELIRVLEGPGLFKITFRPRLDFGRSQTRLVPVEDGLEIDGWVDPAVLHAPGVTWQIEEEGRDQTATAIVDASAGPITLELRYGTASTARSIVSEPSRRDQTLRFWTGWARTLVLPGLADDAVKRSALVIKALCHAPTGAIAAAATTSLPEHLGGVRNWDYRFCWVRDACMSAASLTRLGNTGVAMKLLDWIMELMEKIDSPERLRPLYTVTGGHLNPEAEISELSGYGGSRPVRIGNAASTQVQLDVFGPIVDLVARVAEMGAPVTPEHWRLVESMVNAVASRWTEPDHGIWEIRGPKRHHVHTKAMCWLAADRGLVVAERAMGYKRPAWRELRDRIAQDILSKGLVPGTRALAGAYEIPQADASTLMAVLYGATGNDQSVLADTIQLVESQLRRGPVVDRYRYDDGLPGREGGWVICAYWLVEALSMLGRHDEAMTLFNQTTSLAGPTGLLCEEFDPDDGTWLGNFPQAYSHLGLIDAACRLAKVPNNP
jgi:trehalose 6-phosphate phosphatase